MTFQKAWQGLSASSSTHNTYKNMAIFEPIWKDKSFRCQTGSYTIYQVSHSGVETLIYSGRAIHRPDVSGPVKTATVKVNSLLYDYLPRPSLPDFQTVTGNFVEAEFTSQFRAYDGGTLRAYFTFINDWSYDYMYNYETEYRGLSFPVNSKVSPAQWLVYPVTGAVCLSVLITHKDGSVEEEAIIGTGGDFNADFSRDFLRTAAAEEARSGFVVLDMAEYPGAESVTIWMETAQGEKMEARFAVSESCGRHVLYYSNAYGGWDFLLLEGQSSESDQLTRHTSRRNYDNDTAYSRGTYNFANEIVKQWTLRTGWLKDEESMRMHHLLNSTDIYLYDTESRLACPVVLTDTATEYKTYRGNGRKLVSYEMTAQLAQDRQRR